MNTIFAIILILYCSYDESHHVDVDFYHNFVTRDAMYNLYSVPNTLHRLRRTGNYCRIVDHYKYEF